MREIKFRAWDKELNFMINIKRYKIDFNGQVLFDNNDKELYNQTNKIELMQYTGLKDKNDVDIYEGDIVSFTLFDCFDNDMQHIGKILFNNGAFYIEYMDKSELYNSLLCYVISQDDEFEVIGNIYENSDVLKG